MKKFILRFCDLLIDFFAKKNWKILLFGANLAKKTVLKFYDYLLFVSLNLALDFLFFLIFLEAGISLFFANFSSYFFAFFISYFIFGEKIFDDLKFSKRKYFILFSYQILALIVFSYLLTLIYLLVGNEILSKFLLLFVTFFTNRFFFYLIMRL